MKSPGANLRSGDPSTDRGVFEYFVIRFSDNQLVGRSRWVQTYRLFPVASTSLICLDSLFHIRVSPAIPLSYGCVVRPTGRVSSLRPCIITRPCRILDRFLVTFQKCRRRRRERAAIGRFHAKAGTTCAETLNVRARQQRGAISGVFIGQDPPRRYSYYCQRGRRGWYIRALKNRLIVWVGSEKTAHKYTVEKPLTER